MTVTHAIKQPTVFIAAALTVACVVAVGATLAVSMVMNGAVQNLLPITPVSQTSTITR